MSDHLKLYLAEAFFVLVQDILKTKQADEVTLKKLHEGDEGDDDWELSYREEAEEGEQVEREENENENGSVDSPLPCHPMETGAKAPTVVKTPSCGSMISNLSNAPPDHEGENDHEENDDDDCVFSLEL